MPKYGEKSTKKLCYFVSPIDFRAGKSGEYLRVRNLLRVLSREADVVAFLPLGKTPVDEIEYKNIEVVTYSPNFNIECLNVSETFKLCWRPNERLVATILDKATRGGAPNLVWFDYLYWGSTLSLLKRSLQGPWCGVWGTHNVQSRITLSQGTTAAILVRFLVERLHELWFTNSYEYLVAVSSTDGDFYKQRRRGKDVSIIPNFVEEIACPVESEDRYALITGNFRAIQNIEGVEWFVVQVLPRVLIMCPDFKLAIAGLGSDQLPYKNKAITLCGEFGDPAVAFANARYVIVPILHGSGTRFKAVEAMAAGKTFVGTSKGLEGLPTISGIHGLITNSPQEFAAACVNMWRNQTERFRMAANAKALFQFRYSTEAISKLIKALL